MNHPKQVHRWYKKKHVKLILAMQLVFINKKNIMGYEITNENCD